MSNFIFKNTWEENQEALQTNGHNGNNNALYDVGQYLSPFLLYQDEIA